ncbi:MAG: hypothetical protein J3K34DRAFT_410063 [Monoraphidium minutum]|nr:MAG: hypothetical protein J3K34DRAFT_410063 [Monoraphidium minutum]
MAAKERLPQELRASNALIMTVSQSKGLEFSDVFLVDFFADSPATSEWGVLLTLLADMEAGAMALPPGAGLAAGYEEPADKRKRGWLRPCRLIRRRTRCSATSSSTSMSPSRAPRTTSSSSTAPPSAARPSTTGSAASAWAPLCRAAYTAWAAAAAAARTRACSRAAR